MDLSSVISSLMRPMVKPEISPAAALPPRNIVSAKLNRRGVNLCGARPAAATSTVPKLRTPPTTPEFSPTWRKCRMNLKSPPLVSLGQSAAFTPVAALTLK